VVGEGNTSCGSWVDLRRRQPDTILTQAAWVLGFVTAISYKSSQNRNITEALSGGDVDHWVDNYCTQHPLDQIVDAAIALSEELGKRSKR